jgi:TonB-linked SusC/RagA family outer membrane protein
MKKLMLLLICMPCIFYAAAQNKTVTGTVTSEQGSPLANVSVVVKGTTTGTSTNADGFFSISVPPNRNTLVFSYVNMLTKEVNINNQTSLTVRLQANNSNMQEVVVTALGITKERRTLGYATQNIKNDALVDKGETSLLSALQGKLAGADITTASGAAGASTSIILRGITTFTGSQSPLMVVDGIPISDNVDESTVGLYSSQSSNRAVDLNVNNIESVNVLQGPAAAALYGSRAAHGAIMITTKKGSGKKGILDITFVSTYTQQKVYGFPELQNKYGQGANGILNAVSTNSWGPAFASTPSLSNVLIVGAVPQYVNGVNYTSGQTVPHQAYPDNIMSYFKTGLVLEQNLSINSGDNKNYINVSIGNTKQDGILPNTSFKRTNVGLNASSYLNDKLLIRGGATYFSTNQVSITQGNNPTYSSYATVVRMPRSINFDYYKNNYTTANGYNNWFVPNIYNAAIQDSSAQQDNPYYAAYKNPIRGNVSRILTNLTIAYDVAPWLNVSYRAGVDVYTDRRKRTITLGSAQVVRSTFNGSPGVTTGGIMEDMFYRNEVNGDLMINAKKDNVFVKGLNANLLLGHNINQRKFQQLNQTGYGLTVPGFYNISNASNLSLTGEYNSVRRLWGAYGQLSLAYNNYLFLELTGRQDHSSTLPKSKNAFFYPSASLSFVLTDALKTKSTVLSFAKLRAAYAKVGNDAPPYVLSNTFASYTDGNNVANYAFPFGNIAGFGANLTLGNQELGPEFTSTLDFGANVGLFNNRLNIDATIYNSISTDQIVQVATPPTTGYQAKYANIGRMTNKGIELTVSGTPIKTKNFAWNISGNFSLNRNKVTYIAPGVESFSFGGTSFSGLVPTVAVGEPYGIIRGSKFVTNPQGERLIDSTTGLYANYVTNVTVLDPNRDWIAGLTNNFTFKNFSLSVLVDYKKGGQFESFTYAVLTGTGASKVTENRDQPYVLPGVIDIGGGKYKPNNIQIAGQPFFQTGVGNTTGASTSNEFYIFDATTFRVREVSIGYDILGRQLKTKAIKTIRLSVYGRNLYFFAPNSPIDPELSTQGGGTNSYASGSSSSLVRGLELTSAPNTRNLGASIRVTF